MHKVYVLSKFQKNPYPNTIEVDTTSKGGKWSGLSPFLLDATHYGSKNFENLWQYSKVYDEHVEHWTGDLIPLAGWWIWRQEGFSNERAIRYPMGKGRKPLYSYWRNPTTHVWEKLGYIKARKTIYIPIYAELVQQTSAWNYLVELHRKNDVVLRDYDGYDYISLDMSLREVANSEERKMGHAFVLAALLEDEYGLNNMLCCGHCSDSSDGHCEDCPSHGYGGKINWHSK